MGNPRLLVPPPTFTPGQYGLLSVATLVDNPDQHWQGGITWDSLCGVAAGTGDICLVEPAVVQFRGLRTGDDSGAISKAETHTVTARGALPFTAYAEVDCSPVAFWDADAATVAAAALTRTEQWQVERIFESGTITPGVPMPVYPHLAADTAVYDTQGILLQPAATTVAASTLDVVEAFGKLEAAMADCYGGGQGVIHAPMGLIPALIAELLVKQDGPRLRTPNGNLVVAGAGYRGLAPNGGLPADGTAWIYGTGSLMYYRSAVRTFTRPDSLDRAENTLKMIAERTYVLAWDCCLFAALVTTGGEPAGAAGGAGAEGVATADETPGPITEVALTGANQLISAIDNSLYAGFTIRETGGGQAIVRVWDAESATGTLLDTISLGAYESAADFYPRSIRAQVGIYVEIVLGTVEGTIRVGSTSAYPMDRLALTGVDQVVSTTDNLRYGGFCIRETTGNPATVRVYGAESATGPLLETISLTAYESAREAYVPGITAATGIYVDVIAGTVEGSIRLDTVPPTTLAPVVDVALSGADQLISSTPGTVYAGFTVRETGGAGVAAVIRIYDGIAAAGTLLDTISISPDESVREFYAPGIPCTIGIYVDVVVGTIEGTLRIGS